MLKVSAHPSVKNMMHAKNTVHAKNMVHAECCLHAACCLHATRFLCGSFHWNNWLWFTCCNSHWWKLVSMTWSFHNSSVIQSSGRLSLSHVGTILSDVAVMTPLHHWASLWLSSSGDRAAEGRNRKVGEDAMLGGLAVSVRRPFLSDLVQPSVRSELPTSSSTPHHRPTGGDHRGGRHRDPT